MAAGAVGLAQRAMDEATRYSMERKTMGKPICQVSCSLSELVLMLYISVDDVRTVVDIVHVCLLTMLKLYIFVDSVRTVVDIMCLLMMSELLLILFMFVC